VRAEGCWPKRHDLGMEQNFDERVRQARWAVQRWARFSVDAHPRPLVLAGPVVMSARGFRSGEAKDAWFDGRYEWDVDVPDEVRARAMLSADKGRQEPAREPLKITHAGRGECEFATDRGPSVLPAYWLRGPAIDGSLWVLDPTREYWQPPDEAGGAPPPSPTQGQPLLCPVELGEDGQSLVIPWLGSHPEIETFPRAKLIETSTAVSAVAVRKDMGFRGGWVTAIGITHRVPARLSKPLGNRVFVDLHGNALQVTAAVAEIGSRP
jgi:hypothetical protein